MCCSFVIPFFTFGLGIFNSPTQFLPIGWVMCCSLWFLSLCLVLEYFQQSYPIPTYRDWVMCCFVIPFVFGLRVFSTVLPNFYLWSRIEWCAALLWFLSLRLVLEYFSTVLPISTYESRDWVMCCSFVIPFFTFGLKSIFQQSYPIHLWKQGLSVLLCDSFLCVWS
jgi:hypothetical protein